MISPFDLCTAFGPFKVHRGRLVLGEPAFSGCGTTFLTQGGASAIELGCESPG